jgi:lipoprotein-releasing system ATP-binding protein
LAFCYLHFAIRNLPFSILRPAARHPMSELSVDHVAKHYSTRNGPLVVLRDVSLTLRRGQNVAILGPSGSGKSTLLGILGALEPPTSGRVVLDGQDPAVLAEPELARFRRHKIGFVFQDHHLLPQCSVLENVLVPTVALGRTSPQAMERAHMLLDRVGLSDRCDHRPAELSGGERERAALARALILQPLLLLADEPTGNLDRTTAVRVGQLLVDLQRQEQTMLIVVTHNLRLAEMMERRLELDDGVLNEMANDEAKMTKE